MPISGGQALFRRPCCSRLSSVRRRFRSFQVFSPTDSCLRVLRDAFVARARQENDPGNSHLHRRRSRRCRRFSLAICSICWRDSRLYAEFYEIYVIGFFYRPKRLSRRRFAWFTVCFAIEAPYSQLLLGINARTTVGNDFEK